MPSRVALIGYCFGGTVGIEMAYAGAPLAATVTIHGTFRDHASEDAKNIKGKALILHGAEDQVSPLAEVNKIIEDLRKAKVDFHYELYSGADHGFSTPQNAAEERANVQSIAVVDAIPEGVVRALSPRARNRPSCDGRHSGRTAPASECVPWRQGVSPNPNLGRAPTRNHSDVTATHADLRFDCLRRDLDGGDDLAERPGRRRRHHPRVRRRARRRRLVFRHALVDEQVRRPAVMPSVKGAHGGMKPCRPALSHGRPHAGAVLRLRAATVLASWGSRASA